MKQQFEDDLVAYLDGELSDDRAEEVRQALEADPRLAEEARRLQETWDLLASVDAPQGGRLDVTDRVMARVRPQVEQRRRRILWLRRGITGALTAAAVVLLAVFLGLVLRTTDIQGPADPQEFVEIPEDVREVFIANLDVVLDHVTLEHLDTVRALEREGVFAAVEDSADPR